MSEYSLIANSGIHVHVLPVELRTQEKFNLLFHEWVDTSSNNRCLDLVMEVTTEDQCYYYRKQDLKAAGFLAGGITGKGDIDIKLLEQDGIRPLKIDDDVLVEGEIYKMNFADRFNVLKAFVGHWLPLPYFFKRSEKKFKFGPLNWARFKLIPKVDSEEGIYQIVLAFDTRIGTSTKYDECPVFPDEFTNEMNFEVCRDETLLMDFCNGDENWEYIDSYLFGLAHPDCASMVQLKSVRKFDYRATYFHLIDFIAQRKLFPTVKLFRDEKVEVVDIDMVVDIGNSRTSALVLENNSNFNQVDTLQLINYTDLLKLDNGVYKVNGSKDPFDMRVAFRKVDFGSFGIRGSKQFIHSSFVRLGKEADLLIHRATENKVGEECLSTMSSPKRYLWDGRPSKEEWKFIVLDGEKDDHVLNIPGLSEFLESDGRINEDGDGGRSYHYSRRSVMTFAFLEMLTQAQTQINSYEYRVFRGRTDKPRRVRRLVVTCPTAMSKVERESLVRCARDAVRLLNLFKGTKYDVEIVPNPPSIKDAEGKWYYDEATCSQLVYVYGEIGHKYKGSCQEFFNLYGKTRSGATQPELTVASLDIGAGTSDLMIARYSYAKGGVTTITPEPLFYDSFYYAGDDMLHELVKNLMLLGEKSAFRKQMPGVTGDAYLQKMQDFFGSDYNRQSFADRLLRRDFNMQYSVPLMYYFLDKLAKNSADCVVTYKDVFEDNAPNERVERGFREFFGFDLKDLQWEFNKEDLSACITKAFEPLLKQIATIMFAYNCDIVLLSGRPASLSPIRNIFLKYYPVAPNRLILLNNYYAGTWYPFTKNTGYISGEAFGSKTIVAVGALLGYYAADFHVLDKFVINTEMLDKKLKSVINYVESSREELAIHYFIEPNKDRGEVLANKLPMALDVRQLKLDSYPSRRLYVIDFNRYRMAEVLRRKDDGSLLNYAEVLEKVKQMVEGFKQRLPFHLTIERDSENREKLSIVGITDRNGVDLSDSNVEINIQSLGTDDLYWLDTGAFKIK